jgi:hypothetical protein
MSELSHSGLEKLQKQIGEYKGYDATDVREKSDKLVRLFLIHKIKQLLTQLGEQYQAAREDDQDRLDLLLKSTKRKLLTINQSLKSPTYIHEPFFKTMSIPTRRLSRIYDLEQNMLEETESIKVELSGLRQNGKDRNTFEEHFLHIDAYVDNINQALFEREALILGDE